MTFEDMKSIVIPEQFGDDFEGENYEAINKVSSQIEKFNPKDIKWGASKFVIIFEDKVIKIPFNGHFEDEEFFPFEYCKDYCDWEADIYDTAVIEGVGKFFASTRFSGLTSDGTPFYESERVIPWEDKKGRKPASDESWNRSRDLIWKFNVDLPYEWLALAFDFYTEEEIEDLLKFVAENGLRDFHTGNIGFRSDGCPVLLDYSGFEEE